MSNQYIPDGYKTPINITEEFTNPIIQEQDNQIMSQIKMVVDVDKDELIKALNYDRHQYECGYQAAGIVIATRKRQALTVSLPYN